MNETIPKKFMILYKLGADSMSLSSNFFQKDLLAILTIEVLRRGLIEVRGKEGMLMLKNLKIF
jgi:hypothetical protein